MLITLLVRVSLAVLRSCVADPAIPPQAPYGYRIRFVQLVVTPGSHAPLTNFLPTSERGQWVCDSDDAYTGRISAAPINRPRRIRHLLDADAVEYPVSCKVGDLTTEGMTQLVKLGEAYRRYLVTWLDFLDSRYLNPAELFVRSTSSERSFRSAVSFFRGLYPPAMPDELLNIVVGSSTRDVLRPDPGSCSELADMQRAYEKSQFEVVRRAITKAAAPLMKKLGIEALDYRSLFDICEWVNDMSCHQASVDSLTDELVRGCLRASANLTSGVYTLQHGQTGIAASYLMREIFRVMTDAMSGLASTKLSFFAVENEAFIALLVALGQPVGDTPKYRSQLAFEMFLKDNDHFIRVVRGSKVLFIPGIRSQADGMFYLHDFQRIFLPRINHCHEMP
jgi:hypothetical protein